MKMLTIKISEENFSQALTKTFDKSDTEWFAKPWDEDWCQSGHSIPVDTEDWAGDMFCDLLFDVLENLGINLDIED